MVAAFPFFKNRKTSLVKVDMHSHLIPGIDDGAKSLEHSIELILELKKMGYEKLITTPHISDMFANTSQSILEGYYKLKQELEKRKIDIELEVAAEYYVDSHFEDLLEKRDILTFGSQNYLLFELSYFSKPQDLESLIQDIKLAGYIPVLAHPERYVYFHDSINDYINLKKMGILFQINLNSIINYYSIEISQVVKQIILHNLVDFVGSDVHHKQHIKYLKESFSNKVYEKTFKLNKLLNDTL